MAKATFHFPPDFRWGTATAAHQVEGDNTNNDWWAWEQGHGHIKGGQKSGKASDWWGDGFEQDMDFAAQMNNTGHRMSIEWSRIEPAEGHWDDMAIDHYRSMLKSMRARNIEPMITLHHFTNPIWLTERGGWETPEVVPLFERFVSRAVEALKDLCDLWITINEPNWYVAGGYLQDIDVVENNQPQGTFPPGKNDLGLALKVTDNMLLGHAAAYHAIHRLQPNARVGIAPNFRLFDPLNPQSRLDRFVASNRDRMFNQIVVDAVMKGKIGRPIGFARRIRSLKNTIDYLGVNYYTREFTRFTRASADTLLFGQGTIVPDVEMSDGNYGELHSHGLFRFLKRFDRIGKPLYVTENGLPDADDDQRPAFLIEHLRSVWLAINQNVPVMGYYHWSLVDNFEWAEGWNLRFGLVELDPQTQARKLRNSGKLYGEICKSNKIDTELVKRYAPEIVEKIFPG